jgi:hypothetical protein
LDVAAERFDSVLQDQEKTITVATFEEDGLAGMAAKDDVVDRGGMSLSAIR